MEIEIFKTVRFDLGAPLSYTFLRRYAKCIHADMKFLTLARYILELALQEYSFSYVSDSLKACAALFLALKLTEFNDEKKNLKSNVSSTEWVGFPLCCFLLRKNKSNLILESNFGTLHGILIR
jgi:hypothetical protein